MFRFVWPLMFVFLAAPFVARLLLPRAPDRAGEALKVPFFKKMGALPSAGTLSVFAGAGFKKFLAALIWCALVAAAARPQWAGEAQKISSEGRNLMLALDVSGSMEEADFVLNGRPVRRWDAVRAVAQNFVDKRKGDRIGVVLFGARAYLFVPLTYDVETVRALLDESDVGMAGRQTAIGDAVGLSLKTMTDVPAKSKVIILLSDGAANAGAMRPQEAAEIAKKAGVKIYTVGVGSDVVEMNSLFGKVYVPRGDEIDEATLKQIAKDTGGRYFRAKNIAELVDIYDDINRLEAVKNDDVYVRPVRELFYWPLSAAFGLSVFGAFLYLFVGRSR